MGAQERTSFEQFEHSDHEVASDATGLASCGLAKIVDAVGDEGTLQMSSVPLEERWLEFLGPEFEQRPATFSPDAELVADLDFLADSLGEVDPHDSAPAQWVDPGIRETAAKTLEKCTALAWSAGRGAGAMLSGCNSSFQTYLDSHPESVRRSVRVRTLEAIASEFSLNFNDRLRLHEDSLRAVPEDFAGGYGGAVEIAETTG